MAQQKLKLSTVVIDHFLRIPNFFSYLDAFVDSNTQWIGISGTFLVNHHSQNVGAMNLWCTSQSEILQWFEDLRNLLTHKRSSAKIVLGGQCVDVFFKKFVVGVSPPPPVLNYIDYFVHGYGEGPFERLLKDELNENEIYPVQSSVFISDGARATKGARIVPTQFNASMAVQENEWLPIEISKGCRFHCNFCFYDQKGALSKSAHKLKEEFLRNYESFGTTGYVFSDDTINDSRQKVELLHSVITSLPFDIEWISYARPDMFYAFPDSIDAVREMGVRGLFLGVETLNKKAGQIAGKGLGPERIKETLSRLRENLGERTFLLGSFIIGLIGETVDSLRETEQYLAQQSVLDQIQYEVLFVRDADSRINSPLSENHKKFGFKEITWSPSYYWEHETLNYKQCQEIALQWADKLKDHSFSSLVSHHDQSSGFWSYPVYRSLGFDHREAVAILKNQEQGCPEISHRFDHFLSKYHQDLKLQNGKVG
jgi:radical SAM superfamily enzyme YgiQ (UPF0313 family)